MTSHFIPRLHIFFLAPSHKPTNVPHDTEPAPKLNGASAPSTSPGSPLIGGDGPGKKKLGKSERERERQKKNDDKAESSTLGDSEERSNALAAASSKPLPRSLAASPAPSTSAGRSGPQDLTSPTDSTGARTPLTARPKRNPWTLFVNQLPVPVSEDEIRTFFGSAATNVRTIYSSHAAVWANTSLT